MRNQLISPDQKDETQILKMLIGKQVSLEDLKQQLNINSIRIIRPGSMITKDYRQDRLNVYVDDENKITGQSNYF